MRTHGLPEAVTDLSASNCVKDDFEASSPPSFLDTRSSMYLQLLVVTSDTRCVDLHLNTLSIWCQLSEQCLT